MGRGVDVMTAQALYNLNPTPGLLLLAASLALVPVVWVLWRHRTRGHQSAFASLLLLTLFLTLDLVMFGAFTRLTDSGLGCPDWPGCYGHSSPLGAASAIHEAQSALPSGPVTVVKAWIEMVHRYLAMAVGALCVVLTTMAWRSRQGLRLSAMTLVWVCLQGAFGALTVTMKLFPAIVTLHLLGGMVLLVLLCMQCAQLQREKPMQAVVGLAPSLRRLLGWALALLFLQMGLGAWVSTNYAVLACSDFPTCQGQWWPEMDLAKALQIWRPLGQMQDGSAIPFAALTAIHMLHRLGAVVVVLALVVLAYRLYVSQGLRRYAHWLLLLLVMQISTGLANVLWGWPLLAAVLHTGGAAGLVILLTWVMHAHSVLQNTAQELTVWQQFYALTKPRVIQLIVFCALIGMVLAVPGVPTLAQVGVALVASLGIYLVAGAAAAFNCIVEKGIDAKMKRTAWRPTAKGQLGDGQTLLFSAALCIMGSAILYWWVNPLTMWLTFATFVGYAVVYTVILKPLTPQNIVIGGASGAMPPVLGWAAMTGDVSAAALILFLIIFLWTPPHFWALALYRVEDYRKSGLPMLPVTHGSVFTRLQILLYTVVLFAACLLPFVYGMSGWLYLLVAVVLGVGFCLYGWYLWRDYSDTLARRTFRFSLIHLSVLFAALLVDHYVL
jgi:heme o synthase